MPILGADHEIGDTIVFPVVDQRGGAPLPRQLPAGLGDLPDHCTSNAVATVRVILRVRHGRPRHESPDACRATGPACPHLRAATNIEQLLKLGRHIDQVNRRIRA